MMESKIYSLCLIGNDVKDEFLEEIKDKYTITNVLKNIPSVVGFSLTESEKEELLKHIYVMSIEEEPESYPTSTDDPRLCGSPWFIVLVVSEDLEPCAMR